MTLSRPRRDIVTNRSDNVFMARVELDGAPAKQADISSVAWDVWDVTGEPTLTQSGTATVGSTVFDTLQADAKWTRDAIGYNFRFTVPSASFVTGTKYRIQFKFVSSGGAVFYVLFDADANLVFA